MRLRKFKNIRTVFILLTSTFVFGFVATSLVSCSGVSATSPDYVVSIPATLDLGDVTDGDFAPKPKQTTLYAVMESDLQPCVDETIEITLSNANLGVNQFVEVTTSKTVSLNGNVRATVYPYKRALAENDTKTSEVTVYQNDASAGTYLGTTTFDIDLVTYENVPEIIMSLYNNAIKEDDYAKEAFGNTNESRIKALSELGYGGTYAYTSLGDWDLLKKYRMYSAGASALSDKVGEPYFKGYTDLDNGARYVLSAKYYAENGYKFGNFDAQYYFTGMMGGAQSSSKVGGTGEDSGRRGPGGMPGGMPSGEEGGEGGMPDAPGGGMTERGMGGPGGGSGGIATYQEYVKTWEDAVIAAVKLNKQVAGAAEKYGHDVDFYLTQENEPMGNVGQSTLEVAMFNAAIAQASAEAGVTNYHKVTIDLVHTYSFLELDLQNKDKSVGWCIQYLESTDWASVYYKDKLGSGLIRKPNGIYDYMKLLEGNVCAIQFSDNNGGTLSPFGGSEKGSATGSHHVLGDGRIDFMEYFDALFNYGKLAETAEKCGGVYLVYEPWYNNISDEKENEVAQKRLVEGVKKGPKWMAEWNLIFNVNRKDMEAISEKSSDPVTVAEGQIAVPCLSVLNIPAGQTKTGIAVQNPTDNPCNFVISVISEDGDVLYKSDSVEPGKSAAITLSEALFSGTYNATVNYETTSIADGSAMNRADVKVKLVVE